MSKVNPQEKVWSSSISQVMQVVKEQVMRALQPSLAPGPVQEQTAEPELHRNIPENPWSREDEPGRFSLARFCSYLPTSAFSTARAPFHKWKPSPSWAVLLGGKPMKISPQFLKSQQLLEKGWAGVGLRGGGDRRCWQENLNQVTVTVSLSGFVAEKTGNFSMLGTISFVLSIKLYSM